MKALVFGGSGKMGLAVAWELARRDDVEQIGLVDRRADALNLALHWLESPKAVAVNVDVTDTASLEKVMKEYDVGISTLPDRRTSYRTAETAIRASFPMVDLLEEFHRRPDRYELEGLVLPPGVALMEYGEWLHQQAVEHEVMFLSGIGFAPGMSNIVTGEGMRMLDRARKAVARVGGIPAAEFAARHPLRYMITWQFEHVLREYMVQVDVIRGGQVVEVAATSERERFRFDRLGLDEQLECAVTPGMPSFLFTRPQLEEFSEKTVRWPGHWEGIEMLKESGLLSLEPLDVHGSRVIPRKVLLAALEPRLRPNPGETDVCVMWCSVEGEKAGHPARVDYWLWDRADTVSGISSMGRVTGFSAAIAAWMLGKGMFPQIGVVAPEDCFDGPRYRTYVDELAKHRIDILEEVTVAEPSGEALRPQLAR
ncbi:MAG: saccharopine dehydrogenase [Chloroflexi bacterium]|nr:saccharopine dehydrogenase [Chloroflexota bacterium]